MELGSNQFPPRSKTLSAEYAAYDETISNKYMTPSNVHVCALVGVYAP